MLTKVRYSVKDMIIWTRLETIGFLIFSILVVICYKHFEMEFLIVPWTPVALVGTAVAFMVGFQNNSAYGRIWEARKIWGGIVNTSRTWGMKLGDMISNEYASNPISEEELNEEKRKLVYRHIAWLTALRHTMRKTKKWEVFDQHKTNREWINIIYIPEYVTALKYDLMPYLSQEEINHVMSKTNPATALLYSQSKHIKELKEKGYLWEFSFLELENLLETMFTLQGKSERIKNFPYPRQYATLSHFFVWVFLFLLPFGIIPEFVKIGETIAENYALLGKYFVWLSVPFCVAVSWVFHTMQRIGTSGENPFEGTANDVPISTIARGIEIDLREMLGETKEEIPCQFPEHMHVQM